MDGDTDTQEAAKRSSSTNHNKNEESTKGPLQKLASLLSKRHAVLFVLLFAVVGTVLIQLSLAATNTVTFKGSLSKSQPSARYHVISENKGTLTAKATFTGMSKVTLKLKDANDNVLKTVTSNSSPISLSYPAIKAAYSVAIVSGNVSGNGDFVIKVTYPLADLADTTPPSVPMNLTSTVNSSNVILSWSASTDNKGVAGYYLIRNGSRIASLAGGNTTYTDPGLANGVYSYTVKAYDAANNVSVASAPLGVTVSVDPTPTPTPTPTPIPPTTGGTGSTGLPGDKSLSECQAQTTFRQTGTLANRFPASQSNATYDLSGATTVQNQNNIYGVVANGSSLCITGPKIIDGSTPLNLSWWDLKDPNSPDHANGAGIYSEDAINLVFWKPRMNNIAVDAFRVLDGQGTAFHIHQAYVTDTRDDCVSSSHVNFSISDSLMECYTGLSWRNAGGTDGAPFNITVSDSIFYVKPQTISSGTCPANIINGKGNGAFWKMDGYKGDPSKIKLKNVIVRVDQGNRDTCHVDWAAATYENVTWVYNGKDSLGTVPAGVTVTKDISVYDNAKAKWLAIHGY